MKEYTFHYGRGTKRFSLDESKVIKEIRMPETPVMEDIPKGVLDAIYHPIGTEPIDKLIKPGQTVTFICNDPTRVANSFDFMPVLVNELNKLGIPDENMQIVFSLGTLRKWWKAWARKWPAESKCSTATPRLRKTLNISALPAVSPRC